MTRDVCVIVVHGINTDLPGYSSDFQAGVKALLPESMRSNARFREVYWAKPMRDRQKDYLERAGLNDDRKRWRKMAVQALGDAAAYQKTRRLKNSSYYYVQRCILDELDYFDTSPPRPVVFVGHSLGAHIVSSFAWDVHQWRQLSDEDVAKEPDADLRTLAERIRKGSPVTRLETFAGLVTLGSNMPLFTFTFGPDAVFPITMPKREGWTPAFPGAKLPQSLKDNAKWLNYYSPNDLLGYPLRPLNDAYGAIECLTDIEVKVEGWIPNPYDAHVKYWTDPRVLAGAAGLIRSIIETP